MTRSKRFLTGLATSYALIGANIVYTLATVPLALHYLGKEEFGLWALVSQLTSYLILVEFGMSGAIARFLTDHKDHINGGSYGSILKTGSRVFLLQGLMIILAGIGISIIAPQLLKLPETLHSLFTIVMSLQAALTGAKIATTSYSSPLWSHQRLDISNLSNGLGLIVNFFLLWIGFSVGWGMYALVAGTAAGFIVSLAIVYFACRKLGLYPNAKSYSVFDPDLFRQLFRFGSGLFLMNLGSQLASASQVILISRLLGVEFAALWAIGTKIFTLSQQLVSKIFDSSIGALAEMVARDERERLRRRFQDLVSLSAGFAALAGAGVALCNSSFVSLWTSGKIVWNTTNDLLLSILLVTTITTRCHISLVGATKEIRSMKYICLGEGTIFILITLLLSNNISFSKLIMIAIFSNMATSGWYSFWRSSTYFSIPFSKVASWAKNAFLIVSITGIALVTESILILPNLSAAQQLALGVATTVLVIFPISWKFAIPSNIRVEFIELTRIARKRIFNIAK